MEDYHNSSLKLNTYCAETIQCFCEKEFSKVKIKENISKTNSSVFKKPSIIYLI